MTYLSQRLIQLLQDALLVEHLSLITVLVVLVDPLAHVGWQLVEAHVLLHLFVLKHAEHTHLHHKPAGAKLG